MSPFPYACQMRWIRSEIVASSVGAADDMVGSIRRTAAIITRIVRKCLSMPRGYNEVRGSRDLLDGASRLRRPVRTWATLARLLRASAMHVHCLDHRTHIH